MWEIFLGPLSVCVSRDEGAQYFILLSMSYRSREVWLLACTNVTTSKRDPDTNLGPNVWTTVLWWPNKRPARVQLAKILVALISVTYPIATGVRCHCPIVASGLNPVHPLVFHATIIFTISSFCRAAPCFSRLHRNSPRFTPLSVSGCDFRRLCQRFCEIWNLIPDLAKSMPRWLKTLRLVPRKRLALPPPPPSLPPHSYIPWHLPTRVKNLRNDNPRNSYSGHDLTTKSILGWILGMLRSDLNPMSNIARIANAIVVFLGIKSKISNWNNTWDCSIDLKGVLSKLWSNQ